MVLITDRGIRPGDGLIIRDGIAPGVHGTGILTIVIGTITTLGMDGGTGELLIIISVITGMVLTDLTTVTQKFMVATDPMVCMTERIITHARNRVLQVARNMQIIILQQIKILL